MARGRHHRPDPSDTGARRRRFLRGARPRAHAEFTRATAARPHSATRRADPAGPLRGENRKGARRDDRAGEAQTMELGALVAAIAACLLVQAFFAACEIAMVVTDESKLDAANQRDGRQSPLLLALLRRRERVLALTLTGANLATVISASVITTFLHQFGPHTSYLAPFILAP